MRTMVDNASVTAQPSGKARKKKAFVVSPIGTPGTEEYRRAYYALKYIFKRALDPGQWEVHRADEGMVPDSINQHVIRSIYDADLIIADLTGHNPNVFYELAVAHGIRKPVVHLISEGERLPFDIIDQRTIFYDITDLDSVEKTVDVLAQSAEAALASEAELVTPLSSYARFSQIRSPHDGDEATDAVASLLEEVVSRLSRLENQVTRNSQTRPVTGFLRTEPSDPFEVNAYNEGRLPGNSKVSGMVGGYFIDKNTGEVRRVPGVGEKEGPGSKSE